MKRILRQIYKIGEGILSGKGLARYRIVRASSKFLKSRIKLDFVEIDGQKMFLDDLDSMCLSINRVYEEFETKVVKKIIKKGDVVVDLGAMIGYYTLIFAKLVGNEGKVHAFEPEPTNFEILKKNVEINGYKNVILVRKAVSSKTGMEKLFISKWNKGGNTMLDLKDFDQSIKIDSIRLDDYLTDFAGKIDFIKIDIEGFEIEAIKGMSSVLQKMKNIKIMTEVNPYRIHAFGKEPKEYLQCLERLGFILYHLDQKKKKVIKMDLHELLKLCKPVKGYVINLLCLKEDRVFDV